MGAAQPYVNSDFQLADGLKYINLHQRSSSHVLYVVGSEILPMGPRLLKHRLDGSTGKLWHVLKAL